MAHHEPIDISREATDERRPGKRRMNCFLLFLFGFCLALLAGGLMIACGADRLARSVVFHPQKYKPGDPAWQPEGLKRLFDEVSIPVLENGKTYHLVGWYFKHPEPKHVILYSHGNASRVADFDGFGQLLRRRFEASALIYDYRGYGKSDGRPTTPGILLDGRAALQWLAVEEKIPMDQIVLWGQSLGGSVAVDLAANVGAKALIIESSFTSLPDAAQKMKLGGPAEVLLKEKLPSVEKIGRYKGPVFISHGRIDRVIPFEQGERLFKAANEPKTFYEPAGDHAEHSAKLSEEHLEALQHFLDALSTTHRDGT